MKTILLGAAALVAAVGMTTSASAADLARPYTKAPAMIPAIYDWSGFYVGINGGGGDAHKCWTNVNTLGVPTVPGFAEGCHDATGGMVGGQLGYRWQSASWVFGVEAQGDWADFKGSNASLASTPIFGVGVTNQTRVDALGLFTGQVGYAWNNVLWYVKGGAAVADDKYNGLTAAGIVFDRANETRWGGAVGTGVEVSFALNWSVGFEYDHLFMGNRNISFSSTAAPFGPSRIDNIKQDVDIGSVRVNYRWGGPVIAKY